jgi:hypothetical protein
MFGSLGDSGGFSHKIERRHLVSYWGTPKFKHTVIQFLRTTESKKANIFAPSHKSTELNPRNTSSGQIGIEVRLHYVTSPKYSTLSWTRMLNFLQLITQPNSLFYDSDFI